MDDAVWGPTVFTENCERLADHDAIIAFSNEVVTKGEEKGWLSGGHFNDGCQVLGDDRETTLGAGEGYDAKEFIDALHEMHVEPHVAQNTSCRRSAVPDAIAGSDGYATSQQKRKLIEQEFGWAKTMGLIRQVLVRRLEKIDQLFVLPMAAYNLTRMRVLGQIRVQVA